MSKKNTELSAAMSSAMSKVAELGILEPIKAAPKKKLAAFDTTFDNLLNGARVVSSPLKTIQQIEKKVEIPVVEAKVEIPIVEAKVEIPVVEAPVIEEKVEAKSDLFSQLRTKVSNVRRDDRCLFNEYIGGHLKLTDQNEAMAKVETVATPSQGSVRITGNSISELRKQVNDFVKEYGRPRKAIIEGNSFVLNTRILSLPTSSREIDLSDKGGIIGKKYINFSETIEGHVVKFAIQPELQPVVSILLMFV